MNYQEILLGSMGLLYLLIFGYILIQNEFRCSYCGKFKLGDKWYRKGMYLHPENILNVCNECEDRHNKHMN